MCCFGLYKFTSRYSALLKWEILYTAIWAWGKLQVGICLSEQDQLSSGFNVLSRCWKR